MGEALRKLSEEDPTFRVRTDENTGQTIISGMGELHLDVIVDRMLREFRVKANVGNPRVAYRETIQTPVEKVVLKYVKQTGGHGQYAHVVFDMEPLAGDNRIVFEDATSQGVIPKQYIPAIEKGVLEAAESGILAGYQVTGVKVTLIDGSFHEVDSSEMAFKMAAILCFKKGMEMGSAVLLEPIMKASVVTPEDFLGDVLGQLNGRRGEVYKIQPHAGNAQEVQAMIPMAEMFGYATALRSATQGRGVFTLEFDRYSSVPAEIARKILG